VLNQKIVNVKDVCERIESIAKSFHDKPHELLYERTMLELLDLKVRGIFTQLKAGKITLQRVRLNEETNVPFVKVQDIHYAPSKYVNNYGRVNRPGQSMFYCSELQGICELELLYDYLLKNKIGHNRLATYSAWEIQRDLKLLVLAIPPSNREISNGFTIHNACSELVESEPEDTKEAYSNQYTLTSNFFLKNAKSDNSVYIICSAIANLFTLYYPDIDGFIFPTVQGRTGCNFVLRPAALDNKMILPKKELSMRRWLITDKNSVTIDPSFYKKGHIDGEDIVWI
jgi:hypothetical protein